MQTIMCMCDQAFVLACVCVNKRASNGIMRVFEEMRDKIRYNKILYFRG